eukprot:2799864-Prymnesium_polylepis.1
MSFFGCRGTRWVSTRLGEGGLPEPSVARLRIATPPPSSFCPGEGIVVRLTLSSHYLRAFFLPEGYYLRIIFGHPNPKLRGPTETPTPRAANIGWKALQTEQAVSYDRPRSFVAILDH